MTNTSTNFLLQSTRAARMMAPHIEALAGDGTVYDKAHALMSIVEQATLALDKSLFWDMFAAHIAGDVSRRDEILNTILGIE